eukprot:7149682-Alexandrium_andersonii.AAC.1
MRSGSLRWQGGLALCRSPGGDGSAHLAQAHISCEENPDGRGAVGSKRVQAETLPGDFKLKAPVRSKGLSPANFELGYCGEEPGADQRKVPLAPDWGGGSEAGRGRRRVAPDERATAQVSPTAVLNQGGRHREVSKISIQAPDKSARPISGCCGLAKSRLQKQIGGVRSGRVEVAVNDAVAVED